MKSIALRSKSNICILCLFVSLRCSHFNYARWREFYSNKCTAHKAVLFLSRLEVRHGNTKLVRFKSMKVLEAIELHRCWDSKESISNKHVQLETITLPHSKKHSRKLKQNTSLETFVLQIKWIYFNETDFLPWAIISREFSL